MHLLQDQHLNKILVTGGRFVGSALIAPHFEVEHQVVNVDKLTLPRAEIAGTCGKFGSLRI